MHLRVSLLSNANTETLDKNKHVVLLWIQTVRYGDISSIFTKDYVREVGDVAAFQLAYALLTTIDYTNMSI